MSNPLPLRSPLNKEVKNADYSYTSPLKVDGSDFPCKGYTNDPFKATADYKAGQSYEMSIQGGASHGGGSCQLSLSYDNGKSFKVIKSIIGGCPLNTSYKFIIPRDAPSGNALFAWTWFNRLGNREMYMNCAQVTISSGENEDNGGGGGGDDSSPGSKTRRRSEENPLGFLPDIFVANVDKGCTTKEGKDVVFPKPGREIETMESNGKEEDIGFECTGPATTALEPVTQPQEPPPPPPSTSQPSAPQISSAQESTATTTQPKTPCRPTTTTSTPICSKGPSTTGNATASESSTHSPSAPISVPPTSSSSTTCSCKNSGQQTDPTQTISGHSGGGTSNFTTPKETKATGCPKGCVSNSIRCDSTCKFSICAGGIRFFSVGSVPAGTVCKNNTISLL